MKKILLIATVLCLSVFISHAQKISIKGQLLDRDGGVLPSATIMLLHAKDSTMANFGVSDKEGRFEIKNVNPGNYVLRATYIGYENLIVAVPPAENGVSDLGTIKMGSEDQMLKEIVIETDRIPMTIKKDTIEYDALAFSVQKNAVVEDLLKRMPGIEIDGQGNIQAQGEQVRRVLVDGKEFFGRDPKMATQNIQADAVSKVQVFDRKSEQSQFTGIDDGSREKTINLELKDDRKAGAFGNTSLGYGTEDRFQTKTNINRFNKKSQLSVLGMGNNINMQGFSVGEFMNFSGNSQRMMSGGGVQLNMGQNQAVPINFGGRAGSNGITTTWAGGVNGNRKISDKTEVNGSYFYNYMDNDVLTTLERENFLPSGNFDFLQDSRRSNITESHRANVRIDTKIDSVNSLLVTANASTNNNRSFQNSESSNTRVGGELQNDSKQRTTSDGTGTNVFADALWRHKFAKKGRTLTVGVDVTANQTDGEGTLDATNRFYRGMTTTEQLLRQRNTQNTSNTTVGTNFRYTEPLGNRRYLEVNYAISQNKNDVDQEVYDITEQRTEVLNTQLSNKFNSTYLYQRPGTTLQVNRDKYNFNIGTAVQITRLRGLMEIQNIPIDNNFVNFLPSARLNYDFTTAKRMALEYSTNVQEPTIQQLQPIIDNRDPLNIYVGNPELRPAYRQSLIARYNNFNPTSSIGFFAFATAEYISNAIVNAQIVDENLVRTTTPVNVDNNINLRGNVNFTFPITKINSRFNIGSNINQRRGVNFLNNREEDITNTTLGGNLRYNYRYKEILEANLTANLNRQLTAYQFTELNQVFLNQTYGVDFTLNFLKGFIYRNDFNYMVFQGQANNFNEAIPMWDMSLARSLFKKKALEMKFSVTNILNRNLGISQRADVNFIERSVTNALGRYYMVTATYSLNPQLNPMEGRGGRRGGGGPIMMFRN